jgi:hypothetical protein
MSRIQHAAETVPGWANVVIIGGSWLLSWLQPLALFITIVWGGLQIYLAIERRWFRKDR